MGLTSMLSDSGLSASDLPAGPSQDPKARTPRIWPQDAVDGGLFAQVPTVPDPSDAQSRCDLSRIELPVWPSSQLFLPRLWPLTSNMKGEERIDALERGAGASKLQVMYLK